MKRPRRNRSSNRTRNRARGRRGRRGLPLLRYEDVASRRRRALRARLMGVLLVLIVVKLLIDRIGDRTWNGLLAQFWQEQCLRHRLPAERVAFVAAPDGSELPPYLGDFTSGTGSTWHGTVGASPYPIELAEFQRLTSPARGVPWDALPGPVFLHGLRDGSGRRRLVTVYALANNPTGWWTLVAAVRDPVRLRGRATAAQAPTVSTACWPLPKTAADTLAVFAGQPDPSDPSRFTIRIHLNGQGHAVTGKLRDDATIEFTSSTGLQPWTTRRAGPIVVPQVAAVAP